MTILSKIMEKLGRRRVITERDSNDPYLIRWYLLLKDRKNFPFNLTLHKVLKSDDPVLHDHPWTYATLILKGGYWENVPVVSREGNIVGARGIWRGPGHFRFRKADDLHFLTLEKDKNGNEIPCWSLFFMGKKATEWGFVPFVPKEGYRWINSTKYLARGAKQE
jgi:hypothetical protein